MRTETASLGAAIVLVVGAVLACKAPPPKGDAGADASASASASASAAKPTAGSVTDAAWVTTLINDLAKASPCPAKKPSFGDKFVLGGAWCGIDDFATGERDGTLDDQTALFGFVLDLSTDVPVATAMKKPVFAVLAVDKRAGDRFATVSTFTDPGGDYATAGQAVTDMLEESPYMYRAEIPKKVWADAKGRCEKASSKVVMLPNGWHYENPTTDVRKVGKVFYSIELTSPKSIRVGVYTDKSSEKK
jgi:hypothetical protein